MSAFIVIVALGAILGAEIALAGQTDTLWEKYLKWKNNNDNHDLTN